MQICSDCAVCVPMRGVKFLLGKKKTGVLIFMNILNSIIPTDRDHPKKYLPSRNGGLASFSTYYLQCHIFKFQQRRGLQDYIPRRKLCIAQDNTTILAGLRQIRIKSIDVSRSDHNDAGNRINATRYEHTRYTRDRSMTRVMA